MTLCLLEGNHVFLCIFVDRKMYWVTKLYQSWFCILNILFFERMVALFHFSCIISGFIEYLWWWCPHDSLGSSDFHVIQFQRCIPWCCVSRMDPRDSLIRVSFNFTNIWDTYASCNTQFQIMIQFQWKFSDRAEDEEREGVKFKSFHLFNFNVSLGWEEKKPLEIFLQTSNEF